MGGEEESRDGARQAATRDDGGRPGRRGGCSLLLLFELQREMGLGMEDAAPRSKMELPGAAQR